MKIRENGRLKRGSAEYEIVKKQVLDLYIITQNATSCYELFRRAVEGEEYGGEVNRSSAAAFFKREDNVGYMEARKIELAQWGFELYTQINNIDTTELREKTDKYADIESISIEDLRTKSLTELEVLKNQATDVKVKADIIKQQTELMDAKMRNKETTTNADRYIHYYLPLPYCNNCEYKNIKKLNYESGNRETDI